LSLIDNDEDSSTDVTDDSDDSSDSSVVDHNNVLDYSQHGKNWAECADKDDE